MRALTSARLRVSARTCSGATLAQRLANASASSRAKRRWLSDHVGNNALIAAAKQVSGLSARVASQRVA